MRRASTTIALLGAAVVADGALAQAWVDYSNESSQRLIAASAVGANDTEEKDYAWGDFDQDGDTDLVVVRKEIFSTPGRRRNVLFMNEGIAEGHGMNGVLVDRTDYANGYASIVPYNAIVIFTTAPEEDSTLNLYEDWQAAIFTHELTHILHMDTNHGIVRAARAVLGRVASTNDLSPWWMIEGFATFQPLEDLRDALSPIRVLHAAVTLAGIADMGPMLPMLSTIADEGNREAIAASANALLLQDNEHVERLASADPIYQSL